LERGDGGRAAGVSLWQEPIENYAISVLRVTTLLMRRQSHFGGNKPTDIGDYGTLLRSAAGRMRSLLIVPVVRRA
jgi:hypothetical protein